MTLKIAFCDLKKGNIIQYNFLRSHFATLELGNIMNSATTDSTIESKIYVLRGQKVMIDSDLAEMYGVETRRLKEQVKRNIERFPEDFMFELTKEEVDTLLRSQSVTLKRGEHIKYLPFAFTEHGVLMLSSVLRSEQAVQGEHR